MIYFDYSLHLFFSCFHIFFLHVLQFIVIKFYLEVNYHFKKLVHFYIKTTISNYLTLIFRYSIHALFSLLPKNLLQCSMVQVFWQQLISLSSFVFLYFQMFLLCLHFFQYFINMISLFTFLYFLRVVCSHFIPLYICAFLLSSLEKFPFVVSSLFDYDIL